MRSYTFARQAEAAIRERRKLSQRELAQRVPVHQTYLSLIESGKRDPSYAVAEAICRALDVDVDELIRPDPHALVDAYSREMVGGTTREGVAALAFDALHDVLHEHADDGHGHCRQDGAGLPCVTVRAITAALSFTPPKTADYDYRSPKAGGAL